MVVVLCPLVIALFSSKKASQQGSDSLARTLCFCISADGHRDGDDVVGNLCSDGQ